MSDEYLETWVTKQKQHAATDKQKAVLRNSCRKKTQILTIILGGALYYKTEKKEKRKNMIRSYFHAQNMNNCEKRIHSTDNRQDNVQWFTNNYIKVKTFAGQCILRVTQKHAQNKHAL